MSDSAESIEHDARGRRAHNLDLVCDGCGSTHSDVRLVKVEDPDGIITTCDSCEPQLRSTIVKQIDSNSLVADGGEPGAESGQAIAQDCPYCEDGELEQIKDWKNPKQCTNGGCSAGFVVVL